MMSGAWMNRSCLATVLCSVLLFSVTLLTLMQWRITWLQQVYVKYSALFRITREAYPYEDTSQLLSRVISSYGANRIMWGRWAQSAHQWEFHCIRLFSLYVYTPMSVMVCPGILFCSDFPYVVPECGYKGEKEAISHVAGKVAVSRWSGF